MNQEKIFKALVKYYGLKQYTELINKALGRYRRNELEKMGYKGYYGRRGKVDVADLNNLSEAISEQPYQYQELINLII